MAWILSLLMISLRVVSRHVVQMGIFGATCRWLERSHCFDCHCLGGACCAVTLGEFSLFDNSSLRFACARDFTYGESV